MDVERLTPTDLDSLQRIGFEPPASTPPKATLGAPSLRHIARVNGIGRVDREAFKTQAETLRLVTEDVLVGLFNYRIPLAFVVGGEPGRALVHIGTWLTEGGSPAELGAGEGILTAGLRGLFPSIDISPAEADAVIPLLPMGGLVLGIPTAKPADPFDAALPFDRIIRALAGETWAALILAQPVDEAYVRDLRLRVINEMRGIQTEAKVAPVPSPLASHYLDLLGATLKQLSQALAIGSWRTAAYLLGDERSYYRLASAWRGVFAGADSTPEPIRVWDRAYVPKLASRWALPEPTATADDSGIRPAFEHQTLLTSTQLAAYVHFPHIETNGFVVRQVPDFDAAPPTREPPGSPLALGRVLERGQPTGADYIIGSQDLVRHAFVTGVTGSGKTNTVFHLLRHAAAAGVPFLVIEPAKTEYRVLIEDDAVSELRVFTLGNEMVSPFRLNPFEVPRGIPVGVHLDLLRSVFSVSFGMWTPLPQVLEVCLHEIYEDRGWDITTSTNRRVEDEADYAFSYPTLTDLIRKVDVVTPRLGYEERITADIRAALQTRINSLRAGGKGRMLDANYSTPMEHLLGFPTVLELEGMGDDDDKAFVMGLVMIRLAEHRRTQGDSEDLKHLFVIEEAHRLLSDPGVRRDETEGDVRGKAVATFANLLSEVRAYGQGIVVVDQVPAKLAQDVIKNTNLKVAHRIVAGDDRASLADAMAMTIRQRLSLATLAVGQAAVFADGEDAPLLLSIPKAKGGSLTWPTDDSVRSVMAARGDKQSQERLTRPTPFCDERCSADPEACAAARNLAERPVVARIAARAIFSAAQTRGALARAWPGFLSAIEAAQPSWIDEDRLLSCVILHAPHAVLARWGARAGLSYGQTTKAGNAAVALFESFNRNEEADAGENLRALLLELHRDGFGPFPSCGRIWGSREGPCLCRYPVAELVESGVFDTPWGTARASDTSPEVAGWPQTWGVAQDMAYQLVEFPQADVEPKLVERIAEVARCTSLCAAQQMLRVESLSHPATELRVMDGLFEEAGHE